MVFVDVEVLGTDEGRLYVASKEGEAVGVREAEPGPPAAKHMYPLLPSVVWPSDHLALKGTFRLSNESQPSV